MIKEAMDNNSVTQELIDKIKKQPCYVKGCNQPVVGGRLTDDGIEAFLCEFHFAEDCIAQIEDENEEIDSKEGAKKELENMLLNIITKDIRESGRLWN